MYYSNDLSSTKYRTQKSFNFCWQSVKDDDLILITVKFTTKVSGRTLNHMSLIELSTLSAK